MHFGQGLYSKHGGPTMEALQKKSYYPGSDIERLLLLKPSSYLLHFKFEHRQS